MLTKYRTNRQVRKKQKYGARAKRASARHDFYADPKLPSRTKYGTGSGYADKEVVKHAGRYAKNIKKEVRAKRKIKKINKGKKVIESPPSEELKKYNAYTKRLVEFNKSNQDPKIYAKRMKVVKEWAKKHPKPKN